MDVSCGQCGTEYEFDDALISERGTTVKCTNCDHQFRIFPPSTGVRSPERWVVRSALGRELVFTSLRDLQRGIAQRQIGPNDLLSRGNEPARPLASIAELEPFFRASGGRPSERPAAVAEGSAVGGIGVGGAGTRPWSAPAPVAPPAQAPGSVPPPNTPRQPTLRPGYGSPPTPPMPQRMPPPPAPPSPSPPPTPLASFEPQRPPSWPPSSGDLSPAPGMHAAAAFDSELKLHEEEEFLAAARSRRIRSYFLAGFVLVFVALLFGATLGRRMLQRFATTPAVASTVLDARVPELLAKGQRLLAEGDFEAAKEQLDKASALADGNPALLSARAHLETLRADTLWLKLRLLDDNDAQLIRRTEQELGRRATKAREELERALAAQPNDGKLARLQIDVLRLNNALDEAQARAKPMQASAQDPQTAYALAMLGVAQPVPAWPRVVEQLQTALQSDSDTSRTRAALVYALVQKEEPAEAEAELAKLIRESNSHPLLAELQAFVHRSLTGKDAGAARESKLAAIDVTKLPKLSSAKPGARDDSPAPAGDFRTQLEQAGVALGRGDLDRAERLYNAVLAKHPGDTEALAGLGDIAHKRKDTATAEQMYERVLQNNPSYLPALMASADQKWERGDRGGAIALYRRVLEQTDRSSAYGQRAAARIALGDKPPAPAETSSPSGAAPPNSSSQGAAESAPREPAPERPQIDTSDLPEENK
jgi:predicted Zn finger-like uncharacterized protein